MRETMPIFTADWREMAHNWGGRFGRLGVIRLLCNDDLTAAVLVPQPALTRSKNTPSPDRCAVLTCAPVIGWASFVEKLWNWIQNDALNGDAQTIVRKINSDREFQCLKHPSFWPQLRFLACLPARATPTPKTRLSVLAHVLPPLRLPTSLIVKQRLPLRVVRLLAHLPTKSSTNTPAACSPSTCLNSRVGFALTRLFSSERPIAHV